MTREESVRTGCGLGFGLVFGVIAAVLLILFLMCAGIGSGLTGLFSEPLSATVEPAPPVAADRAPEVERIAHPLDRPKEEPDEFTPPILTPEEAAVPVVVKVPPLKKWEQEPVVLPAARYVVTLSSGKTLEALEYSDEGRSYKFKTRNGGSIRYPKQLVKSIEKATP